MHTEARLRKVAFFIALAVFGCTAVLAARRIDHPPQAPHAEPDLVYLPKAEYLRPMSLGHANALADILWFRTISYFGQHYRSDRLYRWLAHMCDLVTDLDPRAEHVYRFAGVILPWEAAQADEGIRLLQKGIQVFPDSWQLHYWLGFNYYFFKSDYAKAAASLHRAAQLPDAHPNAARLAALLYNEQYGPDTAVAFLHEMERSTDNATTREVVHRHLLDAQFQREVAQLTAAVNAYRARFGSLPAALTALVDAGLVPAVPADPFGGTYEIDPVTGGIRSSTGRTPAQLHQSPLRARLLSGESARDL